MEISIKWNICRICLREDDKDKINQMKPIFGSSDIAKNIFDFSGVVMKPDDGLPDKICLKCMKILKYAVYFRKTCKLSDANLKSVIQRAKSATNIFKQEWAKEPTADESISYDDDDDIDDALTSIALNGEEEEQEKETSDQCIKRKVDHQELPIHKKIKVIDTNVQNSIQEKSEKLTPKYDSDQGSSRDVITYDDNELDLESDLDNVVEEMKLISKPEDGDISNSSRMINEETPLQENNEDHIPASALDVYNNSHVNLESNSNQNLVEKIMDGQDLGIGDIGEHIEDEEDIEPIGEEENENKTALYYIINDVKGDVHNDTETNEHFHEQHVHASDDNVDFIPLDEDEDDDLQQQQQQFDDIHTDMDDNQSHVTSTVVTKDELDFDTGSNSNVSQDTDSEYIIDEYVIDDGDNINQRITSKKRQNSSGNSSNKHVQKPPVIRKQGATIIGSSTSFPIVCEICGNNFTSRQLLNVHMKIHRQEKTHECELCFKRFITACNLQAHMRVHTGEKPYECQYCSRRFSDRSTHIRHERIHTNEKPFSCDNCGKSFALATTLQAHLKVHTGERPYRCEPCAKSFKLAHQLKAHKNTSLHRAVEQLGFQSEYMDS